MDVCGKAFIFHLSFFPFFFSFSFPLWTCPIFIHAFFYSEKQKERKMGWYRGIGRGYLFFSFVHWPSLITVHCARGWTEMEPYGENNDQFTHSIISLSTRDIAVFFIRLWRCYCYNGCIPVVPHGSQRRSQTCASLFLLTPLVYFFTRWSPELWEPCNIKEFSKWWLRGLDK